MAVPYTFGTATASIPLSQLDSNFATTITLGNTAIQLGNTVTTLNNMTLANVTIGSGSVTLTNIAVTTANVTTGNVTTLVVGSGGITSTGNVGIGTTATTSILNVYSAANATVTLRGDGVTTNYIAERYSTDTTGPNILNRKYRGSLASPTAVASGDGLGGFTFQAWGGTTIRSLVQFRGFVDTYTSDSDISSYLTFTTSPSGSAGGVERARITSAGNLLVGVSSANANGGILQLSSGITFPATAVAATNANTLDDYEEGSWTPVFSGYTGTYNSQTGKYVKIGQLVYIECLLQAGTATFTTPSNVAALTGLPFAALGVGYIGSGPGSFSSQAVSFNLTGNDQNATGTPNCFATSSSTIQFAVTGSGGGSRGQVLNSAFGSNSISEFSCNYRAT